MRSSFVHAAFLILTCAHLVHAQGPNPSAPKIEPVPYKIGLAKIDITPKYPIRLNGFGFRRTESEGVTQRIWAKALAIDDGQSGPALLIAVDILGIPDDIRMEVAKRLEKKAGLKPDRLALTATHTHTAPMLKGANLTIFGVDIPKDHLDHIDRYTAEFLDKVEQVGLEALEHTQKAYLRWGLGTVGFAANRRTPGGPVDHDLPLLVITDAGGKVKGLYASYACHCVTLSNNKISGDWAGFAAEAMEDAFPGSIALISVGCGADANPKSGVAGDKVELATRQGREIAQEVQRMVAGYLMPIAGSLETKTKTLDLPLADLPDRAEWKKRGERQDAIGYHARWQLAKLDRQEELSKSIKYYVQSWRLGDSLAMLFLPGEVVVDYSRRLKRELDGRRLWINAYANGAPCYIPSERILKEGGYEGGGAMIYYDVPMPFKPGLEEPIVAAARDQLADRFLPPFDPKKTQGSLPLSPQQSQAAWRTKPGLQVDLVAAEPLVVDPVAIDFGPDGRLWVAEMCDYPSGRKGKFEPGGRIRVLEDSQGNGHFDKATVFLDNIPFPTGITVWKKGVLICAAPDILYAEDTKHDGRADVVRKLYSGFGTDNYQARVNSLEWGLDGWVYGSCGLFGGNIYSHLTKKTTALGDRDFRIKPDTGEIEPATGRTQQGRVRNNWDDWFGCDNSCLGRHYALADHYLRRNANVAAPDPAVFVPDYPNPTRLYPARKNLQLFKLSGPAFQVTSACGIGVYCDDYMGNAYAGDVFTCEPVNLMVHRMKLTPRGSSFAGHKVDDEQESEFASSLDGWCRPVQVKTGPDGALWVVDMYRFVIEHPRWIPPEDLAQVDVRAGQYMGRLYRIRAADKPLRPWPKLDTLDAAGLVTALDSPNGWQSDMASQLLMAKKDTSSNRILERLALEGQRPEGRVHALVVLDALRCLRPEIISKALGDPHPGVRRHAVRLAEGPINDHKELSAPLLRLTKDDDAQVRLQLAYSLGAWKDSQSGRALAELGLANRDDPYLAAAILSSVTPDNVSGVIAQVLGTDRNQDAFVDQALALGAVMNEGKHLPEILEVLAKPNSGVYSPWQLTGVGSVFESFARQGKSIELLEKNSRVTAMLSYARAQLEKEDNSDEMRLAALPLLGRKPKESAKDIELITGLLLPSQSSAVQAAAIRVLSRINDSHVVDSVLAHWSGHSPALKGQIVDMLLSRENWTRGLLDAFEKKAIPIAQLDTPRRQRLLQHKDAAIQSRAAKLFSASATASRANIVEGYQSVFKLAGDKSAGKLIFGKTCSVCHQLEGVGHAVGPDLAQVVGKTPIYLLTEILDPNRNVDSRYIEYQATLKDGRTFTGLLQTETTTSITLRGQEGKEQVILRRQIDELTSSGKSLMPEGLEKDLSKQGMADLLAYLTSTAPAPKTVSGNQPAVVVQKEGRLSLLAANAEIRGNSITFENEFQNIGFWQNEGDSAAWSAKITTGGEFDIYLDYACAPDSAGNFYILEGIEPAVKGTATSTGGWDQYKQIKIGTVKLDPGERRFVLRSDGPLTKGALLDLKGVYLVPKGQNVKSGDSK